MKSVFCILTMILSTLPAKAELLTFKDWKAQQMIRARQLLNQSKQTKKKSGRPRGLSNVREIETPVRGIAQRELRSMINAKQKLRQAELGLQAARDLTIQDYFEIYLNSQPDREKAFNEVAKKLSPEEMAQLLSSYGQILKSQ